MSHYETRQTTPSRRIRPAAILLLTAVLLAACGTASGEDLGSEAAAVETAASHTSDDGTFLDGSTIHEISVQFDQGDYERMIETYTSSEVKEWIAADVTIDGITYSDAGIRLKGNSSLRGLGSGRAGGPGGEVSAEAPEDLPWLIRLDKFVDGQNHAGIYDLVVRSNNSETALNEAVALELLEAAGLASQEVAYAAFSVNGSAEVLRLLVEHPDNVWLEDAFADSGVLYKAEATGDYSYRGNDPDAYDEVFDLEAGEENGDLTPLIEFLDFINNADDATFNRELATRFDIDGFATYLAMQELIGNFDDIDGPGNNSYLYYDTETETFTVVPWDHNLAFGVLGTGGGPDGFGRPDGFTPPGGFDPAEGFSRPEGFDPVQGFDTESAPQGFGLAPGVPRDGEFTAPEGVDPFDGVPPDGGGRGFGGGPAGSNILVERFLANEDWQALYEERIDELRASLYASGAASEILDTWTGLLIEQAGELIDQSVVTGDAGSIVEFFT